MWKWAHEACIDGTARELERRSKTKAPHEGLVQSGDVALMTPFASTLEGLLRQYYVVGGMPGYRDQGWMRNVPLCAVGYYGLWAAE